MPTELAESALVEAVTAGTLIEGGSVTSAEGLKYDFRLGKRVLFGGKGPIDLEHAPDQDKLLRPGELVYVLSEERIKLPGDIKAELSNKRKMSDAGIVVLGGFCVDPGYSGKLLLALFNLSATPLLLQPGKKIVAAQFYKLTDSEIPPPRKIESIDDFPEDIVRLMLSYQPLTNEGLQSTLLDLSQRLENLRSEFEKKETWFQDFQKLVEENGRQVRSLTEGLKEETANRKESEREFRKTLEDVQRRVIWNVATLAILAALIVSVVTGLVLKALH